MKSKWTDDFAEFDTRTLLNSTGTPTDYEKENIIKVIKYYHDNNKAKMFKNEFDKIFEQAIKVSDDFVKIYDYVKSHIIGCKSNECFLMHAADCYGLEPRNLLMECIAINSRINKLDTSFSWFDNFSLNSFLLQISTLIYKNYETKENTKFVYSVPYSTPSLKELIVKENHLLNPVRILKYLCGDYRVFMETGENAENQLEPEKLIDKLVQKYPYFTGCTHGCDVLNGDYTNKSLTYDELESFLNRYPKTCAGYIFNTSTYASGKGQHWVALIFRGHDAYLICSCGGSFKSLNCESLQTFLNKFNKYYSKYKIQNDDSSCGMYSVLDTLAFVLNQNAGSADDIFNAIKTKIGTGAKGLNNGGMYRIKEILAGYRK